MHIIDKRDRLSAHVPAAAARRKHGPSERKDETQSALARSRPRWTVSTISQAPPRVRRALPNDAKSWGALRPRRSALSGTGSSASPSVSEQAAAMMDAALSVTFDAHRARWWTNRLLAWHREAAG